MPRKSEKEIDRPWNVVVVPLVILLLLSSLIGYFVPQIPNSTKTIFTSLNSIQLRQILALVLMAAITVIFLAYYRTKFFFSTRWLVAAVSYNVLIILVKFTLSTNQYASRQSGNFSSVLSTALLVSLLYVLAFGVLYLFFDGKLLNRSLHKALVVSSDGKVLLAIGLFVCATLARIIIFRLPFISGSTAAAYLGDVFKTDTTLLSALLFVMILAAVEAYAQVRRRMDLKYFFVSGLGLIVVFHVTWAIFIFKSLK